MPALLVSEETMSANFDFATAPLSGVVSVEASAGTGKTWNLCRLYRRLIVEAGHEVGQILVVTFTEAATAELSARIWQHLHESLAAATDDLARRRLQAALAAFDEAAIFTIHGFCRRALSRLAFLAHQPLGEEEVIDARAIVSRIAKDFWRRHVLPLAGDAACWVLGGGIGLEELTAVLQKVVAKPLARLEFGEDSTAGLPALPHLADELARTASLWQEKQGEALTSLQQAVSEKRLNGRSFSEKAIAKAVQNWQAILNGLLPSQDELGAARLLTATGMAEKTNKGKEPPKHELFTVLERLMPRLEERQRALAQLRLALLRRLASEGPRLLAEAKRTARVLTFDDMLLRLYEGIAGPHARSELIEGLRQQFRSALIDEFQDTDPLQLAIFRALFAPDGPLYLIGDPKQAIYSFRGADLYSYFAGKKLAGKHDVLTDNQRSSEAMIEAVNRLFTRHERAFRVADLNFTPARKGVKPLPSFADRSGISRPALAVWSLDELSNEEGCDKACVRRKLARATAVEIARLLGAARADQIILGDRPLQPKDIAVLVRTHAQAMLVASELAQLGITAVRLGQENVFATPEAGEILTVLHAIAEPARFLRAALATVLLGRTSSDLLALTDDEAAFAALLERFQHYRTLWLTQGFARMWQRLLADERVIARLLSLPQGERRATNVLHLTELLSAAARQADGPAALPLWLHRQRNAEGGSEEALLRLESDENLVQIVTKHRAKGLEYSIVFCPFLWDDGDEAKRAANEIGLDYHDAEGTQVLHFAAGEEAVQRASKERDNERLRLIYVALTRAVHRCYIAGGVRRRISAKGSSEVDVGSMLNWLIAGSAEWANDWRDYTDAEAVRAAWQKLCAKDPATIGYIEPVLDGKPLSMVESAPLHRARPIERLPQPAWTVASFTSLQRQREESAVELANEPPAADHDQNLRSAPVVASDDVPADDILRFPRGIGAGDCLHALFEQVDFARSASWPSAIERALRWHLPKMANEQALIVGLKKMLEEIVRVDLLPGVSPALRLSEVPAERRLVEMEFHLAVRRRDAADFRRLLNEMSPPRKTRCARFSPQGASEGLTTMQLDLAALQGFLRGRIDLIFEHDGRWYVLDWKSNHLGDRAEDYAPAALAVAMRQHGYELQALIYLLALHRFLIQRLGARYDPERQLGGAFYLFVRGVRRSWPQAGIWHWRPDIAWLERLSALLAGGDRA